MGQKEVLNDFLSKNKGKEFEIAKQALDKGYDKDIVLSELQSSLRPTKKRRIWPLLAIILLVIVIAGGFASVAYVHFSKVGNIGKSPLLPSGNPKPDIVEINKAKGCPPGVVGIYKGINCTDSV